MPRGKAIHRMTLEEFLGDYTEGTQRSDVKWDGSTVFFEGKRRILSVMYTRKGKIFVVADICDKKEAKDVRVLAVAEGMKIVGYKDNIYDEGAYLLVHPRWRRVGIGTEIMFQALRNFGYLFTSPLSAQGLRNRKRVHARFVEEALIEGRKVPEKVLAGYPELKGRYTGIGERLGA